MLWLLPSRRAKKYPGASLREESDRAKDIDFPVGEAGFPTTVYRFGSGMAVGADPSSRAARDLYIHLQRLSKYSVGSGRGDPELCALSAFRDAAVAAV